MDKIKQFTVIDAHCGAGKTEYMIRTMRQETERPFLYISPFRQTFERLKGEPPYEGRGVGRTIYTPDNRNPEGTKLCSLKRLIEAGRDIMSTHALFLTLDEEAIELIRARNYHLIIDEALGAVTVFAQEGQTVETEEERMVREYITRDDIAWLMKNGHIRIDKDKENQVVWVDSVKDGELRHRYSDIERIIKSGAVCYARDCFLVWSFPITALQAFSEVTVLTYRFSNSIMQGYLAYHHQPYEHKTVMWHNGEYVLEDFRPEVGQGNSYAELIHIHMDDKLNAIGIRTPNKGRFPMSSRWYEEDMDKKLGRCKVLKDNATNFLRHYCKADRDRVMWTTFKRYNKKVNPKGYTQRSDKTETFVPCSSRATEEYIDRGFLVYLVDRHLHPGVDAFLRQRDIVIDKDEYALSELIQWIFRSRIRNDRLPKEDREIFIYIPSARMRTLLLGWLGCEQALRKK